MWIRIDDNFNNDPKIIGLSHDAIAIWLKCLVEVNSQVGRGRWRHASIPRVKVIEMFSGCQDMNPGTLESELAELIDRRLIEAKTDEDGIEWFEFVNWDRYNGAACEAKAKQTRSKREAGRIGGRKSGEVRAKRNEANTKQTRSKRDPERSRHEAKRSPEPEPEPEPYKPPQTPPNGGAGSAKQKTPKKQRGEGTPNPPPTPEAEVLLEYANQVRREYRAREGLTELAPMRWPTQDGEILSRLSESGLERCKAAIRGSYREPRFLELKLDKYLAPAFREVWFARLLDADPERPRARPKPRNQDQDLDPEDTLPLDEWRAARAARMAKIQAAGGGYA